MEESIKAARKQVDLFVRSAYLFLSIAAYSRNAGLEGFASWAEVGAKKKLTDALKLNGYLADVEGGPAEISLGEVDRGWSSVPEPVARAAELEEETVGNLEKMREAAEEEGDHPTANVVNWFLADAKKRRDRLHRLREHLGGADEEALYEIDEQLREDPTINL